MNAGGEACLAIVFLLLAGLRLKKKAVLMFFCFRMVRACDDRKNDVHEYVVRRLASLLRCPVVACFPASPGY